MLRSLTCSSEQSEDIIKLADTYSTSTEGSCRWTGLFCVPAWYLCHGRQRCSLLLRWYKYAAHSLHLSKLPPSCQYRRLGMSAAPSGVVHTD